MTRTNGATPTKEPAVELPPRQPAMTTERQLVVRIWVLEDELAEVKQQNAELQTALAKASGHAVDVPPVM